MTDSVVLMSVVLMDARLPKGIRRAAWPLQLVYMLSARSWLTFKDAVALASLAANFSPSPDEFDDICRAIDKATQPEERFAITSGAMHIILRKLARLRECVSHWSRSTRGVIVFTYVFEPPVTEWLTLGFKLSRVKAYINNGIDANDFLRIAPSAYASTDSWFRGKPFIELQVQRTQLDNAFIKVDGSPFLYVAGSAAKVVPFQILRIEDYAR